jgi:prepilin-type N-terminal cleavage/methylation domain-containing protein
MLINRNLLPVFSLISKILYNNLILKKERQFMHWKYFKYKAFTLAEVLITLLIIGVIASLVIPALINDIQDSHYKTAYKKAFAVATQAWNSALSNNEIIYTVGGNYTLADANFKIFKNYFKIMKDCPIGSGISNCWSDGEMFSIHPITTAPGFLDASGMSWSIGNGTYNYIIVDTNGFQKPNKYGRDRFVLLCKTIEGDGDGLPVKLGVYRDYTEMNNVWCPSGGCYYQSWLK